MGKLDHRELMQLYDGELGEERSRELQRLLATSSDAKDVWFGLEQVGLLVREVSAAKSDRFDVAGSVMAQIGASDPAHPAVRRRGQRLRRAIVPAFGLAAAAALAMWIGLSSRPLPAPPNAVSSLERSGTAFPSASSPPTWADRKAAASTPSIQAVDFGGQSGTIFMLEGAESQTFVVWLSETGDNESKIGTL